MKNTATLPQNLIDRPLYTKKLFDYLNKPAIKIVTGMRRSGKSSIVQLVIKRLIDTGVPQQNIIYINKEFVEFADIRDFKDLHNYVQKKLQAGKSNKPRYLFIDEVQQIDQWQRAIADLFAKQVVDIVLSGSNSVLLGGKLATLLSGRYVTIQVLPLSFKEFVEFNKQLNPDLPELGDLEKLFMLYLRYGGLPAIPGVIKNPQFVVDYQRNVLDTIVYKDILQYYQIKNVQVFNQVLAFLFDSIASPVSGRSIANCLKSQNINVSVETVLNYIKYLETAYAISTVKRYDLVGKRYLNVYQKIYVTDLGLRNALVGYKESDINKTLENIVYLELLRRGYEVSIGKINSSEVDFVAQKRGQKHYFQVAYLLASKETEEREFGNLLKIKDNYPKTVLSMDKFYAQDYQGIKRQNIIEFLMEAKE